MTTVVEEVEPTRWGGRLAEVWLSEEDVVAYLAEEVPASGGGVPELWLAGEDGADYTVGEPSDGGAGGLGGPEGAGAAGDPVVLVGKALGVLGRLNDWLAGMAAGTASGVTGDGGSGIVEPGSVRRAMEGLAGVDAALSAARLRGIVAADVAGLPECDGAVSLSAWVAGVFGLSGATAAREVRLAVGLADEGEVLDRLQAG
ncbi:hypothetical protein [Euzebya rosea]|uniref:hypothetical protein n=1 Tax=Euzebya rosea TaxID=2052804 RepID=UPI0013004B69|nr:hypothetical protein [Euzebya rosea]